MKYSNETVIWITGASKGIGRAIANRLAQEKYHIVISGRNMDALHELTVTVERQTEVLAIVCDVRSEASIRHAYEEIINRFGRVDVLINNAGIGFFTQLTDMSVEEFDETIATNLRGTFLCIKTVVPAMLERQSGTIITMNSIAAVKAFSHSTAYAPSKAGALALTRSLREEVRHQGIKVIDILPGATETEIWDRETREEFHDRMMQPEDIADLVAHVLSGSDRMMIEEIIVRPQKGDL